MTTRLSYTRLSGLGFLLALLVGCQSGSDQSPATNASRGAKAKAVVRIGLVYTAPHTWVSQVAEGFKQGLKSELKGTEVVIIEKHAGGVWSQFGPTVDAVLAQNLDLIAPITTPISQLALKGAPATVPVCFLGVTDPLGAGLIASVEKPEKSTGVSDLAPFKKNLEFIRKTLPNAKVIGFPYHPGDQPALFGLQQVKRFAPEFGFQIREKTVSSKAEVSAAGLDLAGSVDCFLIGSDNLMFEAAPDLVTAARQNKKPVFACDSTSIKSGAIGGYTIDYPQVGLEGAKIAARILRGEPAGIIPVLILNEGNLELNLESAKSFGVEFPEAAVKAATVVYR